MNLQLYYRMPSFYHMAFLTFIVITYGSQPHLQINATTTTSSDSSSSLASSSTLCSNNHPIPDVISPYLHQNKPFHIQGWRWHTLSLVRDAGRLERLAIKLMSSSPADESESDQRQKLETAAKHVIDFNMKELHRIENELFFPWLRQKMCSLTDGAGDAFRRIIDDIEEERRHVAKIGRAVKEQALIASSPTTPPPLRLEATSNVAQMSAALTSRTRALMEREDAILVPAVAAVTSPSEQKSFNTKVIRQLGLFDGRIHLVGMHDAVWEMAARGKRDEREVFEREIPMVARMMIGRWRRSLYLPRAGVLEEGDEGR